LSPPERDYLAGAGQISPGYDRVIRSRLQKKAQFFIKQELPLLVENGFVTEFCNITKNCNLLNDPDYSSQLLPLAIFMRYRQIGNRLATKVSLQ
jgi:hypothetical protein